MGYLSQIGLSELTIMLVVVLLLFGARRIPEIGASLGKAMRQLKRAFHASGDETEKGGTLPRDA